jgi:predicted transcriptional regulator
MGVGPGARGTTLDAAERPLYDTQVTEPRPTEQPSASAEAERQRVVAKIERGLADVKPGRVIPHAEVVARLEALHG